jgi:hypothetical protein
MPHISKYIDSSGKRPPLLFFLVGTERYKCILLFNELALDMDIDFNIFCKELDVPGWIKQRNLLGQNPCKIA